MTQKRIEITSTLIKAVKDEDKACPARIKALFYDRMKWPPTLSMLKGQFFESLCLGDTTDRTKVETLPRLKNDNKSTDQRRIEDQAAKFLNEVVPYFRLDLRAANLRPELRMPIEGFGDRYEFVCHLDFISPFMDPSIDRTNPVPVAIVDLKLTKSILSTFGDFAWGRPELMDHTQPHAYVTVWEMVYGEKIPFYYIVFEYDERCEYKVIRKEVTPMHKQEFLEATRRTIALLENWEQLGWREKPSHESCTRCPLAATCPMFRVGHDIDIIT